MDDSSSDPKIHTGRKTLVTFIGGDYHGDTKQLRAPIRSTTEVAKPPKYLGNNFYEASVSALGYETYILTYYNDKPYYVLKSLLDDFNKDPEKILTQKFETTNQRLIREEQERLEAEEKERERQAELARKDFDELGIAIEYLGKRVNPRDIRIFINRNHDGAKRFLVPKEKI